MDTYESQAIAEQADDAEYIERMYTALDEIRLYELCEEARQKYNRLWWLRDTQII